MGTTETPNQTPSFLSKHVIQIALQLLVLFFLLRFCFYIIAPFQDIIIWAIILSVTLQPLHARLKRLLKEKGTLASVLITVAMLAVFIVPAAMFTVRTAGEIKEVVTGLKAGNITIPPPAEKVKEWPIVGHKAYDLWQEASGSLDTLTSRHPEQMKRVGTKVVTLITSTTKGLLFLAAAIIVCGVFLVYATEAGTFTRKLVNRLTGNSKIDFTSIAVITIRNVVKGILGVAVFQSLLAATGMIIAGIPYAGLWTLLCLVLAIVQIGTLPVALGVIIYIWGEGSTFTATWLTIWMLVVGLLDNILKPLVMGKGAPVPMLVIFLGAIGGFMYSGFIGLFTGAVILSLGYRLFDIWLKEKEM